MSTLLETARLRLREFRADDADRLVSLDADPEVMRYISRGVPTPRESIVEDTLPYFVELYAQPRPIGFWAVERRLERDFIGWIHLRPDRLSPPEQELGYRFFRHAWGQGYASEGSRAVVALAFEQLQCDVVSARTLVTNLASQRVMHKCGLTFEEHFVYPTQWLPDWSEEERRAVKYSIRRAGAEKRRERLFGNESESEELHPVARAIAVDEKVRIQQLGLGVVLEPRAVGADHAATGRFHHGLCGCSVPFAGQAETRIKIGAAFGDQAELDRAADGHELVGLELRQVLVERGRPGASGCRRCAADLPRAGALSPAPAPLAPYCETPRSPARRGTACP